MARQIATWKTVHESKFYAEHTHPLSKHAGLVSARSCGDWSESQSPPDLFKLCLIWFRFEGRFLARSVANREQ